MTKMARLTVEDGLLIKAVRIEKGWSVDRMIAEFPARQWKRRTLYYFVRIDSTGRIEKLPGSGRRRSVRTDSNIELVEEHKIPVSLGISRGLLLVSGCPSWLQIKSLTTSRMPLVTASHVDR